MLHSRTAIEEGDLVILFMSRDNMTAVTVTRGEEFHNKFGKYKHDDMIGMRFGSKMHSPPPHSGYLHLLKPTPELWTLSLPHRTQILYMPDIAYITMKLGVRVGGKVIEAGTGSGSMTHSLSRTVGSKGKVHSFEYHKARFEAASQEFIDHKLENIQLQHRNVCKDGFGDLTNVEAIFLDLPAPWEAIPHAVKVLNPDIITRICCFSPCLEQVLKTATALRAEGFTDVSTKEVLIRTFDLVAPPPTSSHHLMDVTTIAKNLRDHEKRKEERRVTQMRNAREKSRLLKEQAAAAEAANGSEMAEAADGDAETHGEKRKQDDDRADPAKKARIEPPSGFQDDLVESGDTVTKPAQSNRHAEPDIAWSSMVLTKPSPEMRGHTSYLTFATFYPASIRAQINAQDDTVPATRGVSPSDTAAAETS